MAKHKGIINIDRGNTVFEEAADLLKAMRGELGKIIVVAVLGIIGTHCYNLVIFLSLIKTSTQSFKTAARKALLCLAKTEGCFSI